MLSVPLLTADIPVIGLHRLLAVGVVTLGDKVHLVLRNLRQVATALTNHRRNGLETLTCPYCIRAERLLYVQFITQIETVTVRIGCCRATVGRKQHFCVRVLTFLATLA